MNLEACELFVDVARLGSFAAAAKERGVDPSSISRSIAALEAELGIRLIQRTTRRFHLTEAGEAYRARVEPLLDEFQRAAAEAADVSAEPRGRLRLTASIALGVVRLTPLLREFREAYPGLRLDCLYTDDNLDLVSERIDLALRLAPSIDGDLIATRLFDTRYHVVASPEYARSREKALRPLDLKAHQCVLLGIRPVQTRWSFRDGSGAVEHIDVGGDVVISTPLGVREAALSGLGPALLSDLIIAEDLAAGRLVDLFPKHRATPTTFDTAAWAIYPSRAFLPGKVRAMIDFLKKRLPHRGRSPSRLYSPERRG